MLQVNVFQVGKNTNEEPFSSMKGGFRSDLSGFVVGAAISGVTGGGTTNALCVGLLSGIASCLLDSSVDVVTYSIIDDI